MAHRERRYKAWEGRPRVVFSSLLSLVVVRSSFGGLPSPLVLPSTTVSPPRVPLYPADAGPRTRAKSLRSAERNCALTISVRISDGRECAPCPPIAARQAPSSGLQPENSCPAAGEAAGRPSSRTLFPKISSTSQLPRYSNPSALSARATADDRQRDGHVCACALTSS